MFENQSTETEQAMIAELQRVAGGDPRIFVQDVQIYPQDNGIRIEMFVQVVGSSTAERLAIFFDQVSRRASYI